MMVSREKSVKCCNEKCKEVFHINENHERGGINDRGYIKVKCKSCGSETIIRMENPSTFGCFSNFEIVDAWDEDDYYEDETVPMEESAIVIGKEPAEGISPEFIPRAEYSFWQKGEINLEEKAFDSFSKIEQQIRNKINGLYNYWVKSPPGYDNIERCIVAQEYESEGESYIATWGKILKNDDTFNACNFHLIAHEKNDKDIDGVFSRDEMMAYLFRCLMRWKLIANQVIVVTPFIGFDFPFSKQKDRKELIGLWNLLNSVLDIEKTTFITRVKTYGSLKKCQNELEVPTDVLKEWDLMTNLQKMVDDPKTRIKPKAQFHAKFYAGVFDDFVELLGGSFNVQTGGVLEQMHLRRVSRDLFKLNYLDRLVEGFEYEESYNPKTYLIRINKNNDVTGTITDLMNALSVTNHS